MMVVTWLKPVRYWRSMSRTCTTSSYIPIKRPNLQYSKERTPRPNADNNNTSLEKRLRMYIGATGPITIAQYMKEVLTNFSGGYYMSRDVFGTSGDFITSPEIGQIFGEMIAVWLYTEWQKCGAPKPLQIIELGPGRGTMIQDVIRVLRKFGLDSSTLSVHLVEVSPFMSEAQAQRLCIQTTVSEPDGGLIHHYRRGETVSGIPVFWYKQINDVPSEFSVVLAHEFFDALPVHKFQMQDDQWREVLVDTDDQNNFRLVATKKVTPMLQLFLKNLDSSETRKHIEHSFEMQKIVEHLVERLEGSGGLCLVMDYGHMGEGTDTFRAFKKHKLHDPLLEPGSADLTADVDFRLMKQTAETEKRLITFGPVNQGLFLKRLGGDERLAQLIKHAKTQEEIALLQSGYEMLTNDLQMGKRFKFFSMFPSVLQKHLDKYPVNGFY